MWHCGVLSQIFIAIADFRKRPTSANMYTAHIKKHDILCVIRTAVLNDDYYCPINLGALYNGDGGIDSCQ